MSVIYDQSSVRLPTIGDLNILSILILCSAFAGKVGPDRNKLTWKSPFKSIKICKLMKRVLHNTECLTIEWLGDFRLRRRLLFVAHISQKKTSHGIF